MTNKFYLTTPIYYVNDVPHIGHAYTTVAGDVLARYKRSKGFDVFYLTGTDEHGQKVLHAAEAEKLSPKEFCDHIVNRFKSAWKVLDISNDDFIRTTDERHEKAVQKLFSQLYKQGDIYKGEYEGWYCTPCESFWTEMQLTEDVEGRKLCPECGRETELLKEETYFFKLSKYQKKLLKHIEDHPDFIQPPSRKNEIVNFIKQGLKDLSVTRTAFPWGVSLKEDDKHVVYVWFDALINYISAIGYADDQKKFKKYWPADVHIMGKEIVRFHTVIWPSMLMAANIPLPKKVFGHGWWTVEGKKMSKSKGNVVDPMALAKEFGPDVVRYFLMREVPFGVDGDFSRKSFETRYNADLANDIGNLLHRTLTMVEKYYDGVVPKVADPKFDELSQELYALAEQLPADIDDCMDRLAFSDALVVIWKLINLANTYIEKQAPWKLAKADNKDALAAVMYNLIEVLRIVAIFVAPTMPQTARNMWKQLGFTNPLEKLTPKERLPLGMKIASTKVAKGQPLFPRLQK